MTDISGQCMELSTLTEEQFSTLVETHQLGARTLRRPHSYDFTAISRGLASDLNLKCLLEHFPGVAPVFWADVFWQDFGGSDRPDTLDTAESVNLLIDTLLQRPNILARVPYLWGWLFAKSPGREEELHRALQQLSIVPASASSLLISYDTFSLRLPAEAHLLPHLLAHLCARGAMLEAEFDF
jgi:hypothetical protein